MRLLAFSLSHAFASVCYWKMLKLNYIVLTRRVGWPTSDGQDIPFKRQINVIGPRDNSFKASVGVHRVAR